MRHLALWNSFTRMISLHRNVNTVTLCSLVKHESVKIWHITVLEMWYLPYFLPMFRNTIIFPAYRYVFKRFITRFSRLSDYIRVQKCEIYSKNYISWNILGCNVVLLLRFRLLVLGECRKNRGTLFIEARYLSKTRDFC